MMGVAKLQTQSATSATAATVAIAATGATAATATRSRFLPVTPIIEDGSLRSHRINVRAMKENAATQTGRPTKDFTTPLRTLKHANPLATTGKRY